MIEEYLRRRTQKIEETVRAEMSAAFAVEQQAWEAERQRARQVAARAERLQHQVLRAAEVLENQSIRITGILAFRKWMSSATERRALREKAAVAEGHARALLMCRAATRWRLFTVAAQEQKRHQAELQASACQHEELRGEVEQLHREIARLQEEKDGAEAKLKAAFMKGMVALNREAAQALHSGEPDGINEASVEELLGGTPSRTPSQVMLHSGTGKSPALSDGNARTSMRDKYPLFTGADGHAADARRVPAVFPVPGVCPVHNIDEDGRFYHKCYAPDSCYYGPRGATRESDPFEVRADPRKAPRHMDAGAPYVRASAASSSSLAAQGRRKVHK
ncbi:hypothetical protein STCU_05745 [Strigomonas culicis]|uniref:Centrosomal protein POC5 n=1 Tax=Strigomonas culicis TaxID=28005 RepID=S9VVN7_9TRYP|nr:hypothetical protein STCU_05745 [Strigomonas culicis]|eukprot:EPY27450.1 hypothetical protein STCU_05745 [Strigomonas culicis]